MSKSFHGVIKVEFRDSVPDWAPFEAPKAPDWGRRMSCTSCSTMSPSYQELSRVKRDQGVDAIPFDQGRLAKKAEPQQPGHHAMIPTTSESVTVSWTNSGEPPAARSPTAAADSAEVAAIGPVTRWRELPNAA